MLRGLGRQRAAQQRGCSVYGAAHHEPLKEEALAYLKNLPVCLTFEWEGVGIYVSHSNPWQDSSVYVYPSRPMALFEEIAQSVEAKVIMLGHTHMPMRIHVRDKLIINPGAIYGNASSDSIYRKREIEERTCGVLSLPDCQFEVYEIFTGCKLQV